MHLFWECPVTLQVWRNAATWVGCKTLQPETWHSGSTTAEKVQLIVQATEPSGRKAIKRMVALISWHIWMERNACVFRGKLPNEQHIADACTLDMEQWRLAGATCIEHPIGDPT